MLPRLLSSLLIGLLFTNLFTPLAYAKSSALNLSTQAKQSIHNLSVNILTSGNNPNILTIKPQLDPLDYKIVKSIHILPDSPFYILKIIQRSIRLFLITDPAAKSYQLLQDGNEKTLESLLVIEKATNGGDLLTKQSEISNASKILNEVGKDFDTVSQTLDKLRKENSFQGYFLQQEAFRFTGYYLKHQVLLQKQADQLAEKDFLTIEQARVKHLSSVAHIVVSENTDPLIFSKELSQLISPQVGSNYSQIATIAILRDLENNAAETDLNPLKQAQTLLQKELEIKLTKLPKKERLKLVEKYISFIHGNPIRQFQAYSQISKSFTSKEMVLLTSALKDKAAQNFEKHLNYLDNPDLQKIFVATLFSEFPVDLRLLFYTDTKLKGSKVLAVVSSQKQDQITRLAQIKSILGDQICQSFGQNPQKLAQTRFYTQNINNPDILDLKVAQFLAQSIQNCSSKSSESVKLVANLQTKINNNFIVQAKRSIPINSKLPTRTQASQILKDTGITVNPQDQQQVAEEIIEETQEIEETSSEDPAILKKEVATVKETITKQPEEIVDEVITSTEPTQEEIIAKEEEIIEQIEEAAGNGETSPLVEELPQEVADEISQETGVPLPTPSPTPILASPTPTTQPTPLPTIAPSPVPTAQPTPTEEPTLMETVTETASEPAPTPEPVTTPSI